MWGGNATYIDILVKAKSVQKVAQKLKENNIQFELLISDVQKAIDEENPPVQEEEETDDRQGESKTICVLCVCVFVDAKRIVYSKKTAAKIPECLAGPDGFRK